jgi:hypothetical protein
MSGNGSLPATLDTLRAILADALAEREQLTARRAELNQIIHGLEQATEGAAMGRAAAEVLSLILRRAGRPLRWTEIRAQLELMEQPPAMQTLYQDVSRSRRNGGRFVQPSRGMVALAEWGRDDTPDDAPTPQEAVAS